MTPKQGVNALDEKLSSICDSRFRKHDDDEGSEWKAWSFRVLGGI